MSVSGTYAFNPTLADYIDEAFERCGIDPAEIKGRHIRSAIRSADLVFSEWQNFGHKQHSMEYRSLALTSGTAAYSLAVGVVDVFHATLKRGGRESEMYPISRSDWNSLHDKTSTGRPDRYYLARNSGTQGVTGPSMSLWPVPENSTDTIMMWTIQQQQDAGSPSQTLDMSKGYYEAFASGLAYQLARKFADERKIKRLKEEYLGEGYDSTRHSMPGGAMGRALAEDRDTAPATLRVEYRKSRRGRG